MERWCLSSNNKSSFCYWFIMLMMIGVVVDCGCIEEERKALLKIKASLPVDSYILPTWVDDGGECCDWERVNCNSTTGRVTDLSLNNMMKIYEFSNCERIWALNVSVFLHFKELKSLNLSCDCLDNGIISKVFESFNQLEVLDLSYNEIAGSIPFTIQALSSLRALSFASNMLNGSLPDPGLCGLKNLIELDLSDNMFNGNLPQCLNSLSSLKLLDISSNQFTGVIPPSLLANLTSLEYIDFSHNKFEGSFSFSSFYNHTKLEVIAFMSDNDKFEVDTEEPSGWIPMFQLTLLMISNCNMNRAKGSMVPSFLLYQHKLKELYLPHNSLKGPFPNWLIENNTMLTRLKLRNNSFGGNIGMQMHKNAYTNFLDISGNHLNSTIPDNIQKWLPNLSYLNFSGNAFSGAIPSSICDWGELWMLDLSDNELTGEVPKGLFTTLPMLRVLKLSNNRLHGEVLSGNISLDHGMINFIHLDNNCFTGKIGNATKSLDGITILDISNNFFTGMIPSWMSMSYMSLLFASYTELVVRNNRFEGGFPCGNATYSFLDISQNYLSGSIPSCLNLQSVEHLHLGSNRFTGSIPNSFRNLTYVLTLDVGNNNLSGRIPEFLGELPRLRILLLRKNNFSGPIPKQLCQLRNASFIDFSSNSLSGSVHQCLQNISGPIDLAFTKGNKYFFDAWDHQVSYYYGSIVSQVYESKYGYDLAEIQEEVQFTTKSLSLSYKGNILNYMSGLDLSCNKLTGEIPKELGLLTHIHTLNLSHNQLTGPIPVTFSNLANIESLDLSSNGLTGKIPSELIKLNYLSAFNVSYNNLSGRLPETNAQFGSFTKASYEGNPFLCGPPLVKKCMTPSPVTEPLPEEDGTEKWYDMDMASFNGSFSSTLVVFLLGLSAILYTNPHWRRRWLYLVEECLYACYYFLYDSPRKLSMLFHNLA